jgi:hypothetical protein
MYKARQLQSPAAKRLRHKDNCKITNSSHNPAFIPFPFGLVRRPLYLASKFLIMQKMSRILKKKAISLRHWSLYTPIVRRHVYYSYHWFHRNACYAVKVLTIPSPKGCYQHIQLGSGKSTIQQLPF